MIRGGRGTRILATMPSRWQFLIAAPKALGGRPAVVRHAPRRRRPGRSGGSSLRPVRAASSLQGCMGLHRRSPSGAGSRVRDRPGHVRGRVPTAPRPAAPGRFYRGRRPMAHRNRPFRPALPLSPRHDTEALRRGERGLDEDVPVRKAWPESPRTPGAAPSVGSPARATAHDGRRCPGITRRHRRLHRVR